MSPLERILPEENPEENQNNEPEMREEQRGLTPEIVADRFYHALTPAQQRIVLQGMNLDTTVFERKVEGRSSQDKLMIALQKIFKTNPDLSSLVREISEKTTEKKSEPKQEESKKEGAFELYEYLHILGFKKMEFAREQKDADGKVIDKRELSFWMPSPEHEIFRTADAPRSWEDGLRNAGNVFNQQTEDAKKRKLFLKGGRVVLMRYPNFSEGKEILKNLYSKMQTAHPKEVIGIFLEKTTDKNITDEIGESGEKKLDTEEKKSKGRVLVFGSGKEAKVYKIEDNALPPQGMAIYTLPVASFVAEKPHPKIEKTE